MMSEKHDQSATVTAADIERSIQALNKMAERLWGMVAKRRPKHFWMHWTH